MPEDLKSVSVVNPQQTLSTDREEKRSGRKHLRLQYNTHLHSSSMKPRRRLPSVDLLPTIIELQESEFQAHSLEEYMESIRELSQPSYPLSGPLQRSRLCPPRTTRFPSMGLAHRPWVLSGLDSASQTQMNSKSLIALHQDPLDWLFTQAQHTGASPEDLAMI